MTEQAAKLTVKVKLHAAQPVMQPTPLPPARLSKFKLTLGILTLVLLLGVGYLLWQQMVGQEPSAAGVDHLVAAHEIVVDTAPALPIAADASLAVKPAKNAPTLVKNDAVALSTFPAQTADFKPALPVHRAPATSADAPVAEQGTTANETTALPSAQALRERKLPEGFSRIVLAATMEQLEPGAAIDTLVAKQHIQRLYLFTELKGYAGQELTHRWSFEGQVQTEALLTIEDSPWRTYSEKWLLPEQLGSWRVEIIDQQQNVLYQHDFQYQ